MSTERERRNKTVDRFHSPFNRIVQHPRLEVINLHLFAGVGLYAAGYLPYIQNNLITPHEPFEARVAHFPDEVVSSTQNFECCLRLHTGGFVDKPLQLFEVRLKQALFLRWPSVLRCIVFEHLGQILGVDHRVAVEYSLCP